MSGAGGDPERTPAPPSVFRPDPCTDNSRAARSVFPTVTASDSTPPPTPIPGEDPRPGRRRASASPRNGPGTDGPSGRERSAVPGRWRRWSRRLVPLAALAVVAGCAPFLWALSSTSGYRHGAEEVPHRPVALVLGAGVRSDGQPSLLLARRLDTAAGLYFDGEVDVVLVSGDNGVEHFGETDTMSAYLRNAGVAREHIVSDPAGFSTWDSCVRAREVFGVTEATVVTQDFHLPRAVRLCRSVGIDAVGVADSSLRERPVATVYGWLREVPAAVAALGSVAVRPEPARTGGRDTGVEDALAAERG